jgi:hypothetical protein
MSGCPALVLVSENLQITLQADYLLASGEMRRFIERTTGILEHFTSHFVDWIASFFSLSSRNINLQLSHSLHDCVYLEI